MDTFSNAQLGEQVEASDALAVADESPSKTYPLESAISFAVEWANLGGD